MSSIYQASELKNSNDNYSIGEKKEYRHGQYIYQNQKDPMADY